MPVVAVRNTKNSIVVFSSLDRTKESIEWKPLGDRDGGDIQQVSEETARSVAFLRVLALGVLEVLEEGNDGDNATAEALKKQAQRFARDQVADTEALEGIVVPQDMTGVIRFSEKDLDAHFAAIAKQQPSDLGEQQS